MKKRFSPFFLFSMIVLFLVFAGCSFLKARPEKPETTLESSASVAPPELVKKPNVAGQFYPGNASELSTLVRGYLDHAAVGAPKGIPAALISPHAGYIYSGPVAAYGYRMLKGSHPRTVIILAPSHHEYFEGAAVIKEGSFETPLGKIPVDTKMVDKLMALTTLVKEKASPFEKEHALEVQLPFLHYTLKQFTLVPLIVGKMNKEDCNTLGNALASISVPGETLIVASSDMSHYHPYKEAQSIDRRTMAFVKAMDTEGLAMALAKEECELCGGMPVLITMYAMKALHCKPEVLNYANSGDTAGPKDKVVGYTSIIFWKDKKEKEAHSMKDEEFLKEEEKKTLLTMARKTLEEYLKTGKTPEFFKDTPVPENLKKEAGMFVTLRKNHDLRGCIGYIVGREPLFQAVSELAISSATRDPRFPPVKFDELKSIHIEISVMSPLRKVQSADEIVLGKHGVYVKKGFYSGIFLPQVATETGWDKETFLRQLCAGKAGLPQDAWKDKDTELQVFTADIFEEE